MIQQMLYRAKSRRPGIVKYMVTSFDNPDFSSASSLMLAQS